MQLRVSLDLRCNFASHRQWLIREMEIKSEFECSIEFRAQCVMGVGQS